MMLPQRDLGAWVTTCAAVLLTLTLSSVHQAQSKDAPSKPAASKQAPSTPAQSKAPAPVVIPDTPAARQLAAWLEVFNAGDPEKLRQYLEQNRTDGAANLDGMMALREQSGGFVIWKTVESSPTRYEALVQERDSDQFGQMAITTR